MDFGIGLGSFTKGFAQGMNIGHALNEDSDQQDIRDASKAALADAQQAHDDAVSAGIAKAMGIGNRQGAAPDTQGVDAYAAPTQAPQATQIAPSTAVNAPAQAPQQAATVPTQALSGSLSPGESAVPPQQTTTNTDIAPAAAPGAPVSSGGLGAAPMTDAQAKALAEKNAPSVMDIFNSKGVPQIAQAYLKQGNAAKAQAWMDYAQNAQSQKNLATWAKAYSAVQMGDVEGAADHFMELYRNHDDGITPISKEVVKDKDGNITGLNVNLRNDATGEARATFVDKNTLMNAGLAQLAPPQMFEAAYKKQQTSDAAQATMAQLVAKTKLDTASKIAVDQAAQPGKLAVAQTNAKGRVDAATAQSNGRLDNTALKAKLDAQNVGDKATAELGVKVDALRAAGYSDQQIRDALPRMLGAAAFKRGVSPEEARRQILVGMSKDSLFNAQPAEKKRQAIDDAMNAIYGNTPSTAGGSAPRAASDTAANPFNGSSDSPAKQGLPFLDTKTGKVIYR